MVYLHVPFCRTFCSYCSFYSERFRLQDADRYVDAVLQEIGRREEEIRKTLALNTLYIGGGTPSVLPPSALACAVEALSRVTGGGYEEFTVEVNPDDITPEYAAFLKRLGVTRVSMGVQSFDDAALKRMARRHTAEGAVRSYVALREAGFDNISLDLIFGRGTDDDWMRDLDALLSLPGGPPEHVSAYQLSVEEGSALYRMVERGRYRELPDEVCERQYRVLCERLREAGYEHYEISNFARPGYRAVHNSAYWSGAPYVGLGPAAHSYGGAVRSWNPSSLEGWAQLFSARASASISQGGKSAEISSAACSSISQGGKTAEISSAVCLADESRGREVLTAEDRRTERIMLSLRTADGIPEAELRALCGNEKVDAMLRNGSLSRIPQQNVLRTLQPQTGLCAPGSKTRLRIPEQKWFISDSLLADLI